MQKSDNRGTDDLLAREFKNGKLAILSLVSSGPLEGATILTLTPRDSFETLVREILSHEDRGPFLAQIKESVRRALATATPDDDDKNDEYDEDDQALHDDLRLLMAYALAEASETVWEGSGLRRQGLEISPDRRLPREHRGMLSEEMHSVLDMHGIDAN